MRDKPAWRRAGMRAKSPEPLAKAPKGTSRLRESRTRPKFGRLMASGRETLANKSSLEAADFKHCYWAKKLKLEHKEHRHNPLNTTRSAQSKPGAADAAVLL